MTFCIQIAMEGIPSSGTRPPDLFFIASILIFDGPYGPYVSCIYIYIPLYAIIFQYFPRLSKLYSPYCPSYSNIISIFQYLCWDMLGDSTIVLKLILWYSNILGLLKLLQGGAPEQLGAKLQHGTGQKLGFEAVGGQGNLGLLGSLQG